MNRRITIKDIARELNIHHSTVSRALRNDKRVKEETRKLIAEYAEKNGYQINMSALQLRGSVKNVIAIIVPNINHNFFSNIVSYITNLAVDSGYIVSIFQSNENYEQEVEIINSVIQHNVAGVIASVTMGTVNSDHFKKLNSYKIPLVLFDRFNNDINVSKVTVNNHEIVKEAVELLIASGCKRIAHISGSQNVNVFCDRHSGYLEAINNAGFTYRESVFIQKVFSIEDGREAITRLLSNNEKPDGLICDSNVLLIGVLLELKKLKLTIPDDIGVIGYSDNPFVEAFSPGVISIVQPDKEIAEHAFALLMEQLESFDSIEIKTISVDAQIIEEYNY